MTVVAVVVIALSALVFIGTLVRAAFYAPDSELSIQTLLETFVPEPNVAQTMSNPVRLEIPSLSVNARVQQVGKNKKGEMAVPSNYADVAWYRNGTVPGQRGSAVINGHVDNGLALPGVFKNLGNLKVGDDVYVRAKDGSMLHFEVTELATYPYTDGPVERIFGADDAARLNLITCTGAWLPGKRTYTERLVVYTTFVDTRAAR